MKTTKTMRKWMIALTASAMISISANAQNDKGRVILKSSVYLESAHAYADPADNLSVRVINILDGICMDYNFSLGKFRIKLDVERHYIIFISREGYESKSFEFSTVKANPNLKYIYNADILLQKRDAADYDERCPSVRIEYDELTESLVTMKYSDN